MSTIAERLLLLRGKTKQGDFAQQLGINPNTLRTYENGRSSPNSELLEQICLQFSVSAEWLLLGKGKMHPEEMPVSHRHDKTQPEALEMASVCLQCAELKAELELEKGERREVGKENRLWAAKTEQLLRENGDLRERCAVLAERLNNSAHDAVFLKDLTILSNDKTADK